MRIALVGLGLLFGVVLALVALSTGEASAARRGPVRWEHKVMTSSEVLAQVPLGQEPTWDNAVAHVGGDGWELVSVVNRGSARQFYFKRPSFAGRGGPAAANEWFSRVQCRCPDGAAPLALAP